MSKAGERLITAAKEAREMANCSKSEGFMLRMPDGLRDIIKASAEAQGRSMNAEIVQILQSHYDSEGLASPDLLEAIAIGRSANNAVLLAILKALEESGAIDLEQLDHYLELTEAGIGRKSQPVAALVSDFRSSVKR